MDYSTQNEETMSHSQKTVAAAIVALIIGIGIGFILADGNTVPASDNAEKETATTTIDENSTTTTKDTTDESGDDSGGEPVVSTSSTHISVSNQSAGLTVSVDEVTVDQNVWVAVYEDRSGQPGNILGAKWIPAGTFSGDVSLLRGTDPGNTYYVILHKATGDHEFDHTEDVPLKTEGGSFIQTQFETTEG